MSEKQPVEGSAREVTLRVLAAHPGKRITLAWLASQVRRIRKDKADERTLQQIMAWIVRNNLVEGLTTEVRGRVWHTPGEKVVPVQQEPLILDVMRRVDEAAPGSSYTPHRIGQMCAAEVGRTQPLGVQDACARLAAKGDLVVSGDAPLTYRLATAMEKANHQTTLQAFRAQEIEELVPAGGAFTAPTGTPGNRPSWTQVRSLPDGSYIVSAPDGRWFHAIEMGATS